MTSQLDILEVIAAETRRGHRRREPLSRMGFHLIKPKWTAWHPTGLSNGQARLDDAKIKAIRVDVAGGMKRTAVALKYGVAWGYVCQLVKGLRR